MPLHPSEGPIKQLAVWSVAVIVLRNEVGVDLLRVGRAKRERMHRFMI